MLSNPLIQRYRASHLGVVSIAVYVGIYAVVVLLGIMSCAGFVDLRNPEKFDDFLSAVFFLLCGIQFVLLWGFGTYNSAQTIRMEHERKSYDFFRMLPMSAQEKAIGIMIGRNQPVLMLVAINTLLMVATARDQVMNFQLQCIVWSGAIALSTLALLSSCSPHASRTKRKTSNVGIVILFLIFFQWFLGLVFALADGFDGENPLFRAIKFGPIELPLFLVITMIAGIVGAWCYIGILRRLTVEDMPIFTQSGAIVFSSTVMGLVLMFAMPHLNEDLAWSIFGGVSIMGLIMSILVLAGTLNLREHYLEFSRRAGDTTAAAIRSSLSRLSNLWTAAGLLAVQGVAILIVTLPYIAENGGNMISVLAGILTTYLFAVLLAELFALYHGVNRHVPLLVSFAGILYIVAPLIFGGLIDGSLGLVSGASYAILRLGDQKPFESATLILIIVHAVVLGGMYIWIKLRSNEIARLAASID